MKTLLFILLISMAVFPQGKEEVKFSKAEVAYTDTCDIREYRQQYEYDKTDACRTIHLVGGMATGILAAEGHYLESFVALTITVVVWNFIKD